MQLALTIIYLAFVAVVAALVIWNLFTEKDIYTKIGGAILLVVLLMRLFLIK